MIQTNLLDKSPGVKRLHPVQAEIVQPIFGRGQGPLSRGRRGLDTSQRLAVRFWLVRYVNALEDTIDENWWQYYDLEGAVAGRCARGDGRGGRESAAVAAAAVPFRERGSGPRHDPQYPQCAPRST